MGYSQYSRGTHGVLDGVLTGYSLQVVAARVQRLVDDVRASAAVVKDLIFKSALDSAVPQ